MAMASSSDTSYMHYQTSMDTYGPLVSYHNDLQNSIVGYPLDHHFQPPPFGQAGLIGTSPTENTFDIQSSSSSDSGWQLVDGSSRHSFESYHDASLHNNASAAVSNPGMTLHIRTSSENSSSQPDFADSANSVHSFGSYDDIQFPLHSPQSESPVDLPTQMHAINTLPMATYAQEPSQISQTSPRLLGLSPSSSSSSPVSPDATSSTTRRRKEPSPKSTKQVIKKALPALKKAVPGEKRVGRRRGPLRPEQRIQAGEIRKLRACLRCKFLKKTCDTGDPCAGCQPSHARLWQVPCTRIDIKDIGYFIKDWKTDYERHVSLGFSCANIKGYSTVECPLYVTHGFGYVLPIYARQVYVRDEDCFRVDWTETMHETPRKFDLDTARLTTGVEGISTKKLSEYLDRHIDDGFERFVDVHFEGTKFLTEMLKTAYRYHLRTKLPIVRKALKLVLAYNLTLHITLVEGLSDEEAEIGKIDDENSKYFGKTAAPVMINFQIKHALALMWRELQRDVLEELSSLYSSVYSGEKLKNWPTIFMLACLLLAVWEEIQFDTHYRTSSDETVRKFCNDMESTPVGVIVGLFQAISQKLPTFHDWDTEKHHQLLNSDPAVCNTMEEVRDHVIKHGKFRREISKVMQLTRLPEKYLKSRSDCKFNRNDFDSLSNKFTSRLVIRAS